MESLLQVKNLQKTYANGFVALRGLNFNIHKGEIVALVGESGCGKSTLARHLLKLENPTQGELFFQQKNIKTLSSFELSKSIQMVFQDPSGSLNPRKKIKAIIEEPLLVQGELNKIERRQRVENLIQEVGLTKEHLERYPHMLSGGQKQRVGIARALVNDAELIVCDEPVSALDVSVQAQVLNLLLDLQSKRQLSYLFITHDLSVVRFLADRVLVMKDGLIVEEQTTEEIFLAPKHEYTKTLLKSIPTLEMFR